MKRLLKALFCWIFCPIFIIDITWHYLVISLFGSDIKEDYDFSLSVLKLVEKDYFDMMMLK